MALTKGKRKEESNTTTDTASLLASRTPAKPLGPPPNYKGAIKDLKAQNSSKIKNVTPLPKEPIPLTPIEARNAWISENVNYSGQKHYELVIKALGGECGTYGTLQKLQSIVHGPRAPPQNGKIPNTASEEQLITYLELNDVPLPVALWTVHSIRDALMMERGAKYWMDLGYCCFLMIHQTGFGRLPVDQVAPCGCGKMVGRNGSQSSTGTVESEGASTGESDVTTPDEVEVGVIGETTFDGKGVIV